MVTGSCHTHSVASNLFHTQGCYCCPRAPMGLDTIKDRELRQAHFMQQAHIPVNETSSQQEQSVPTTTVISHLLPWQPNPSTR